MDWVKLAVRYYADPRIEHLDDAAELLFVRGLARAGEVGRGGFIPESSLPLLTRRRRHDSAVSALVSSGLWTKVAGGYQVTTWSDWQDGIDELTRRRAADRERKRRKRGAEREQSAGHGSPVDSVRGQSADVRAPEGEEDRDLDKGSLGEGESPGQRARASPPPRTCSKHRNNPDPPPCTPCKNARLAREQYDSDQAIRQKAGRAAIAECRHCDGDGYAYTPGTHTVETPKVRCVHPDGEP